MTTEELTFYSAWYCPFAQRSWAVLEHLSIPYLYQEVDPYDKSNAWLKVSRGIGQVPVPKYRQNEKEEIGIPDSLRIIDYLDELEHRAIAVYPTGSSDRAEARFWIDQLGRTIVPYFYRFLKARPNSEIAQDSKNKMIAGIEALVQAMSDTGPFFFSDQPGVIDFAFAPFALRIELLLSHYKGFQLPETEEFSDRYSIWWQAMKSVPAFGKTMPQPETYEARLIDFYLPYSIGGGQEDVTQIN